MCLDEVSLLINVVLVVLGGAADQTHLCKYSRGPGKENKRAFKESREWAWRRSRLSERVAQKKLVRKAPQLFFSVKSYQEHVAIPLHPFALEARQQFPLQIKGRQFI